MKHIAIGPGAIGYFSMLGAVNRLWDAGALHELESISGASAGALLAVMIAVFKFDFDKILQASLKVPLKKLRPNIKTLFSEYGLVPRDVTRKLVSDVIPDVTFEELYKMFPTKVYISAFCVELTKTDYFSVDSHPQMSVVDAVCMSIAIPFLFSACTYGDWHYLDGGAIESSPCAPYLGRPRDDVYIMRIDCKEDYKINDFKGYMSMILGSILRIRHEYNFPTCIIDVKDIDIFDFSAGDELKMKLFALGYEKVWVPSSFQRLCTTCHLACTCHSQTPESESEPGRDNRPSTCEILGTMDHLVQTASDVQDPCAP